MRALVTGASGFIGGAVARALIARGWQVRALCRAGSAPNLAAPDAPRPDAPRSDAPRSDAPPAAIEVATGDLRDARAVHAAAAHCDAIFHVGGLYSFTADRDELHATNVDGTRHVLDAARATGARVVHTSSISTIGGMRDGVVPDETQDAGGDVPGPYKESKWYAERLVRDEVARGVDAVIVNPTFPVGWGDVKPTPTGAMIRDFLAGRIPAYVDTGMNVVDVDDVAVGHVLAFEKGKRGERYILGNANLMMRELLAELAELAGKKAPRIRLPYAVALGLAHAGALVGRSRVPLEGVRTAQQIRFADCSRAIRELGLPRPPIGAALAKAVHWFEQKT